MNKEKLLEQKSLVDSFLKKTPCSLSAFSFVNIFAWGDFFDFEFKIINEQLCIFAWQNQAAFLYWPPLGQELHSSTVEQCFEYMAQQSKHKGIHRIENIPENLLVSFSLDRYNQFIKSPEYLYRKEDLIKLKGNVYKSQRHDCNYFKGQYPSVQFCPYTDGDLRSCLDLYALWADNRQSHHSDAVYVEMLKENRQVHERLLKHWQELGLVVRVLKYDQQVIGYTFGYPLDESAFCVYAEIADLERYGVGAYLFNQFCQDDQLKQFTWINAMDDFAMPQLAKTKMAWHPVRLIPSYSVSLKS